MNAPAAVSPSPVLLPLLRHLRAEPSRTWSVIVTVYGDAVLPRGGSLWLGTTLTLCAAMGIGANAVRTAVSRLAADGLLERAREGRNSFYRLAEAERATFLAAGARIYAARGPVWDGVFRLAFPDPSRDPPAGFYPLAPGAFVATSDPAATEDAILLRATTSDEEARRLAARAWPPEPLATRYRRFVATFSDLAEPEALDGVDALAARVLLIHDWRRLVLRDPLPDALRPPDWPGAAARALCARLYRALLPASEAWLGAHGAAEDGALPPPAPWLHERFALQKSLTTRRTVTYKRR